MSKPGKWRTQVLSLQAPTATAHCLSAEIGFCALSEAVHPNDADTAQALIDEVHAQVQQGEDLTASFLNAHARVQRERVDCAGARLIALRQSAANGAAELAWVGHMHALLLRGSRLIRVQEDRRGQGASASGFLTPTQRLDALAGPQRVRPRIDRNLLHLQRGDLLLLATSALDPAQTGTLLRESFKGFGNLEYKCRKLQGELAKQPVVGQFCVLKMH